MSEYIINDEQIAENRRLHGKKLLVMPVIVRCCNCKHFNQEHDGNIGTCDLGLEDTGLFSIVEPDGFCAWGERREL